MMQNYLKVLLSGGKVVKEARPLEDGLAHYEAGRHEAARPLLEEALAAKPSQHSARVAMGRILLAEGDGTGAAAHLSLALRATPNDADLQYDLGECFLIQGSVDFAADSYRHALKIAPDHAKAQARLGAVLFETKKTTEALVALNRAIYLDRKAVDARFMIAQICIESGDFQRALTQLHLLKTLKGDDPDVFLSLAAIFEHLGDYRQVVAELGRVVALGAADGPLYWRLGQAHLVLSHREEALHAFQHATACDYTLYDAHQAVAILAEELGRYQIALEANRALVNGTAKHYRERATESMERIIAILSEIASGMGIAA